MLNLEVKNTKGEVVQNIELPASVFQVELVDHVVHSVVKAYQMSRRQGTHATKTRSLVSGGSKKPFRQKGTGNARQGSTRGPHMEGGAVVHGPQPRSYRLKTNRKTKNLAVKMVLSNRLAHKKIIVVDNFALTSYSTKQVAQTLGNLGVERAVLIDNSGDNYLYKSSKNLVNAKLAAPAEVNAEDLLRFESCVISLEGLKALTQRLGE